MVSGRFFFGSGILVGFDVRRRKWREEREKGCSVEIEGNSTDIWRGGYGFGGIGF